MDIKQAEMWNSTLDSINKFTDEMLDVLSNDTSTADEKQEYLASKYETAYGYMQSLKGLLSDLKGHTESSDTELYINAQETITRLHNAIAQFKDVITIDSNTQLEDTIPHIDSMIEDTVPVQGNGNMSDYTHMFICNSEMNFISAKTDEELVSIINDIVEKTGYCSEAKLYKIIFDEIPLRTRTILDI